MMNTVKKNPEHVKKLVFTKKNLCLPILIWEEFLERINNLNSLPETKSEGQTLKFLCRRHSRRRQR